MNSVPSACCGPLWPKCWEGSYPELADPTQEYWLLVARRCAGFSRPAHLYSGASQPAGSGEELGRFPSRPGMAEGKGGIGGERETGRSYRSLLHGSDQLLSARVAAFAADRDSAPRSRVGSAALIARPGAGVLTSPKRREVAATLLFSFCSKRRERGGSKWLDSEIDPMPWRRVLLRFDSILADRHAVSQIRWKDCKGSLWHNLASPPAIFAVKVVESCA